MKIKIKHLLRKFIIPILYKKYVEKNDLILADVDQTLKVRGSKALTLTPKKRFAHLMHYYPEFAFVFFWRIKKRRHFWKFLFLNDFSAKIFGSCQIQGGLMCYHPFGTVINAKSIGMNFQFRNTLTIGNKGNDNSALPVIGNNVTVGANVVVIGDIQIGDNVVIGAGSVVVKDIPSNVTVAGNPARVIKSSATIK